MEENLESNRVIYFQVPGWDRWRGQRERRRMTDRGKASAGRNVFHMEIRFKKNKTERSQSAKSRAGKVHKHNSVIHRQGLVTALDIQAACSSFL